MFMSYGFKLYAEFNAGMQGNTILHDKQYHYTGIDLAQHIIANKIYNQMKMLKKIRKKTDYINSLLDIGYTILFNFIECILNVFGFDVYKGVLHTDFYMRKSLVCDLVEPFRPIIDWKVRTGINLGQFKKDDFIMINNSWQLDYKKSAIYGSVFIEDLLDKKDSIFLYIRSYYRAFMKGVYQLIDILCMISKKILLLVGLKIVDMIIISYDISDSKLRTRFSKYIMKYGHRLQYSVYEIDNSDRVLNNIICQIKNTFEKKFEQSDSVIIFQTTNNTKIYRFGYAKNEETDIKLII